MKTIVSCVLSLAFLLFANSFVFAQQDRWSYVGADVNEVEFFIDRKSIEPKGRNLRVWHKTVHPGGSYRVSLIEWACSEKKYFVVNESLYDAKGGFIGRDKTAEWLFVTPESINEGLYKAVCNSPARKKTQTSAGKMVARIIAKTANIRAEANVSGSIVRTAKIGEKFILADENPTGGWYQIIIPGTSGTAWIHGNTIKLVEITIKPKSKKKRKA